MNAPIHNTKRAIPQLSLAFVGRFSWLLLSAALVYGFMPQAWAQSLEDTNERLPNKPKPEQLLATDHGVLEKILWNDSSLVIDGKTYRFNSANLVVFYLNRERTIVGLKEGVAIRFQIIDEDYIAAIWVDEPHGMIVG